MILDPHEARAVCWFANTTGATVLPHEVGKWLRMITDEAACTYVRRCVEMHQISRKALNDSQYTPAALLDSRLPGDLAQQEASV